MNDRFKPYPRMRDSGVEWIGYVPTHWEVVPIRAILAEINVRDRPGDDLLSVTISQGVIRQHDLLESSSKKDNSNSDKTAYKLVRPGDIAYNKMRAWQGALGVSDYQGIVSPAYVVERLRREANPRYLHHLMRTPGFVKEAERWSYGITSDMWSLRPEHFKLIYSCVPTLSEQNAIVRFLDGADQRFRGYIRSKQNLIALLQEQTHAIIDQAVIGQIDARTGQPYADYRASEIECIGDVPKHWSVRRLKSFVTRIDQGASPQAENQLADQGAWGVLKAGCVNRGVFRETEHKRLPPNVVVDTTLAVATGDILVSRASGSPNLVGSVGRVSSLSYNLVLSDKTFRPRFNDEVDARFMVLVMNGRYYRQQVDRAISGAEGLANNLPLSSLRSFWFAIPSFAEQVAIVEYAGTVTKNIRSAVARLRRSVSLMRDYRDRLTVDVATGKLDVRAVTSRHD